MKQKLLNKLWLRVGMIVAIMTTVLSGTAWAQTTYALQQVTSVEAGGMYVFEQGGHVMNNTCSNNALQTTATYKTSGLTGTETYVWTLETATGGFYMKNVNGTGSYPYLNNASGKTNVSFEVNKSSIWAFNFQSDNTVLIQNTSNSDRFLGYTTATSYAYKAYATSNLSSYPHAIKVYQLVEEEGGSTAVATTTTIDASGITNTDVYTSTAAGSLSASVTAGGNAVAGATVSWSSSNTDVAAIASDGTVTLVSAGSVTFTASYAGVSGEYQASSATYQMTVTSSAPDFTTLPFEWAGGTSASLKALDGVKTNGLGSDYASGNAPYLVKLDGTGDYIQVKTDSQPGKVTIGVKMLGGATASSITVQESADGETFTDVQALTISGAQNDELTLETTNDFAATTRYVRLLFTKGSNVGVGAISIAAYTEPVSSITIDSNEFELTAGSEEGYLGITYSNLTINDASDFSVQFCDDQGVALSGVSEPDWIDAEVTTQPGESGYFVYYLTSANDGAARTAYFKVRSGSTYSNLVTVTQAAYVAPSTGGKWIQTDLANLTENNIFVIVGNNGNTYAMTNNNGTGSAPSATAVTIENSSLSGAIADNIKWNISGDATNGYTFYPNGETETWLYCTATNNGVRVGTNANKVFTLGASGYLVNEGTSRYVGIYNSSDWRCYTTNTGNIASQTFSFYKQVESVKLNDSYGYATYASTSPLDFTDYETAGYSAWAVASISGTTITFNQITGVVPAGTGMLLMGTPGATVNLNVSNTAGSAITNKLVAITSATDVTTGEYYGLSGKQFVKVNAGIVPAGKALLPASEVSAGVKAFTFVFEDDATGIEETLSNSPLKGENIYNLAGQMVNGKSVNGKLPKGIYIVNGKKVMIK